MVVEEFLASFGGAAGAVVALAIWANHRFNSIIERIAKLEGFKEGKHGAV